MWKWREIYTQVTALSASDAGCQLGLNSAYYGILFNLVLYMANVFHEDSAASTSQVNVWAGFVNMSCILGAFISNGFLGDYLTSALLCMVVFLGTVLIALSATLPSLRPGPCLKGASVCPKASPAQLWFLNVALYLIAFGFGFQPCLLAFGADQYDITDKYESKKKPAYFMWYYVYCGCLTTLLAGIVFVNVDDKIGFGMGYGVGAALAGLGILLFLSGSPLYRYHKTSYNPFNGMVKAFICTFSGQNLKVSDDSSLSNHSNDRDSIDKLGRSDASSVKCRILDQAASATSKGDHIAKSASHRTLWTLDQLTRILKLLPIWVSIVIYALAFSEMPSLFVLQGSFMNTNVGKFHIPPAMLNVAEVATVVILTYIYEWAFVPFMARLTGRIRGITQLQRIGIGHFLALLAMAYVAILEKKRLHLVNPPKGAAVSNLSVLWQIPQYSLLGASEVFANLGQFEFFYDQAPERSQSCGTALSFSALALGNFFSGLLVTVLQRITRNSNGSGGWIPENIDHGHVDYYFLVLTLVTAVNFLYFLIVSSSYQYKQAQLEKTAEDFSGNCG